MMPLRMRRINDLNVLWFENSINEGQRKIGESDEIAGCTDMRRRPGK
jgi:hypothetical protein